MCSPVYGGFLLCARIYSLTFPWHANLTNRGSTVLVFALANTHSLSERTRSPCCLAGFAKGTVRADAMSTGLGRNRSKRAEPKVSKAADSSSQLEMVRAPCHLHVVLFVVVCRRFPTCPSISSGAPLEGLGSNPGVEDLPLGPGDHRRHRDRRSCRSGPRFLVLQLGPATRLFCVSFVGRIRAAFPCF